MEIEKEDNRPGIQSVEIAARILGALAAAGSQLALKELSAQARFPVGKVHRYLVSLTRCGLVEQDESTGFYGIGPAAIALGLAGLRALSPLKEATRRLPMLRDELGETVFIALWTDAGPVVAALEESSRPVFMNIRVGTLLPLLKSASGLVYLAWPPNHQVIALSKQELKAQRLPAQACADIVREVQDQGYAVVRGTLVPGVTALAAPVFDGQNRLVLAMGVLGRDEDLAPPSVSTSRTALVQAAAELSAKLGHRP